MINGKRVIALIPARGGSKRLPKKNILPLAGKPLIGWTIEAAQKSKLIDDIFVSTDDPEIAEICEQFGLTVPELRCKELATDTATAEALIFNFIEKFCQSSEIIILLQPTSPLRNSEHIDEALELYSRQNAFSVVSVTQCEYPPEWSNTLPKDRSMKDFIKVNGNRRSQDLEQNFRLNGSIFIYNVDRIRAIGSTLYQADTFAYIMKGEYSIDIDNIIDFKMAEFFIKYNNKEL